MRGSPIALTILTYYGFVNAPSSAKDGMGGDSALPLPALSDEALVEVAVAPAANFLVAGNRRYFPVDR